MNKSLQINDANENNIGLVSPDHKFGNDMFVNDLIFFFYSIKGPLNLKGHLYHVINHTYSRNISRLLVHKTSEKFRENSISQKLEHILCNKLPFCKNLWIKICLNESLNLSGNSL